MTKQQFAEPDWPTTMRLHLGDGRIMGTDNSMWLYKSVPMGPVVDAASPEQGFDVARPVINAMEEIASLVHARVARRYTARGSYRQVHVLLVNVPEYYVPPQNHPNYSYLLQAYGDVVIERRVLLFGVRLLSALGQDGGLQSAVDSVVQTLVTGTTAITDYDRDFHIVESALARSGFMTPTSEEIRIANAWWNYGRYPDTPVLVHGSHLHIFTDSVAASIAAKLDGNDCTNWPDMENHFAVTMATVQDFDLPFLPATDPMTQWAAPLVTSGARAVSIRGLVEPDNITRQELRRQKKRNIEDLSQFVAAGKMERTEQEEKLRQLDIVEGAYALGALPTLNEASVLVAFDGQIGDIQELGNKTGLSLHTMDFRQQAAMFETMLCSPVRANPHLHDIPTQTLACSGLPSLATVGDAEGALIGFTENDHQASYLSPTAASTSDGLPLALVVGATGSGKALDLATPVITPDGPVRIAQLNIGDEVVARDGNAYPITEIFDHEQLQFYNVHFSDGQIIRACGDHQWIISHSSFGRQTDGPPAAVQSRIIIDKLNRLMDQFNDNDQISIHGLFRLLIDDARVTFWQSPQILEQSLRLNDYPFLRHDTAMRYVHTSTALKHLAVRTEQIFQLADSETERFGSERVLTTGELSIDSPHRHYAINLGQPVAGAKHRLMALEEIVADNETHRGKTIVQTDDPGIARKVATLVRSFGEPVELRIGNRPFGHHYCTIRFNMDSLRRSQSAQPEKRRTQQLHIVDIRPSGYGPGRCLTVESPDHSYLVADHIPTHNTMVLLNLADQYARSDTPVVIVDPKALTLDTPVDTPHGQKAIGDITIGDKVLDRRGDPCTVVAQSQIFTASETKLYRFLFADGRTVDADADHQWMIYQKDEQAAFIEANLADQIQWRQQHRGWADKLEELATILAGDGSVQSLTVPEMFGIVGATPWLERTGAEQVQRILEASDIQPSDNGNTTWPIHDALVHFAALIRADADTPYGRTMTTRRLLNEIATNDKTTLAVPSRTGDSQTFLEIVSIEEITPQDAQCISVDSPDHSYSIHGGIITHNTGSDHSAVVAASGGQIISLDSIAAADGVFDPLRFAISEESAVDMATSMLLTVNPWGSIRQDYERPLNVALAYGVQQGATSIGQALQIALKGGRADAQMVNPAFDLAESSPMFRACFGINPGSTPLRLSEGITLIKVGSAHLDLPDPGAAQDEITLGQRVALALVKMMVFGSAMALMNRRGVVMLDEAWVFLGAGRSEVERLGRLARSQGVLPMLFTQRVTDALEADLSGYISRGFILPIHDVDEATAACELFKLAPTSERIGRITAKSTLGTSTDGGGAPNWSSMHALRDPSSREIVRGAVGIYADLFGRAVPVEVKLSDEFLKIASTNPEDIRKRLEEMEHSLELGPSGSAG